MIKVNKETLEVLKERSEWAENFGCPFTCEDTHCTDLCGRVFPEIPKGDYTLDLCPCAFGISSNRIVAAMKEIIEFNT